MTKYSVSREDYTLDIYRLQKTCLPQDDPIKDKKDNHYWVARTEKGEAVAFIIMQEGDGYWYLARAGTIYEHSGKGLYKRLLKTAFMNFRKSKSRIVYTDCAYWNIGSANGLIGAGFRLYTPTYKWGFSDGLYWMIKL